ncbi:ribosomal RNA small subunit methyltransferase E [Desulfosarcina ovata subsp. ovata]|uniref:Ribosomal RNA small subunit methyltransferase E n=1 Tax=Desulfosarcina ovata subsp. ovata TaxID=2752305 RepID=A0A5K8AHV2_9BACT|nr:ribosomal RNA small subunit methyltransferase E [Desulfosarcina ovata subsp. ovata]
MALRRFYIPPEMAGAVQPEITGSDAAHICRVLRLASGDTVELFDGTGRGYTARIVTCSPKRVAVAIEENFAMLAESPVHITLAQGVLKDRKMDALIRQLTELGIDTWMPFYAARSIPVPGSKGLGPRLARWEKIALEAVKQCRRGCLPQIAPVDDFDAVIASSASFDLKIIFWEETLGAFRIPDTAPRQPHQILVVVGPEGGFSADEIQRARTHGFLTAGLGTRILRAETATLAACTLVQYCFGDMGR